MCVNDFATKQTHSNITARLLRGSSCPRKGYVVFSRMFKNWSQGIRINIWSNVTVDTRHKYIYIYVKYAEAEQDMDNLLLSIIHTVTYVAFLTT